MRCPTIGDQDAWDDKCDAAFDSMTDEELAARRRRNAAQTSPEILSLQEAFLEGQRAGTHGTAAALNPYQHTTPEHAEWERGRMAAIAARLAA